MHGLHALMVCRISQANAKQRAGRSGRVQEGTCYRLYPREVFEQLAAHTAPEMRCMPLEAVVLQLKSIGATAAAACHASLCRLACCVCPGGSAALLTCVFHFKHQQRRG